MRLYPLDQYDCWCMLFIPLIENTQKSSVSVFFVKGREGTEAGMLLLCVPVTGSNLGLVNFYYLWLVKVFFLIKLLTNVLRHESFPRALLRLCGHLLVFRKMSITLICTHHLAFSFGKNHSTVS